MLLFGSGLIGSAVAQSLCSAGWSDQSLPWDWNDRAQRDAQSTVLSTSVGDATRIDIIWAAGVSGFASSTADMQAETMHVEEVASMARVLAQRSACVTFHLFSSIGGLHEGQSRIGPGSPTSARRPYGEGKLAQESHVLALADFKIVPRVYRLSSVYGYARNGRRGLFPAMIAAMLRNRSLVVFGAPSTLRDYVFANDIGDYIATTLDGSSFPSEPSVEFLASGKPTSLDEAIVAVEAEVGRRLYRRFMSSPHNSANITVKMSARPREMPRTPLAMGLSLMHHRMLRSFVCDPSQTL